MFEHEVEMAQCAPVLPPMPAAQVARRSLILAAVMCRGFIDTDTVTPETNELHHRILDWLTKLDLYGEMEPGEEELLRADLGSLEQKEVTRITWYAEGLAILSWALNRFDFPRHDQLISPQEVAESLWFLSDDAGDLIRSAQLRDAVELEACREILYDIHVRLRDFFRNGGTKDFAQWIEKSWVEALRIDPAHLIAQKDLAIDDTPISEVHLSRIQECEQVTRERRRAVIWLVERYPYYSETPVDT